MRSFVLLAFTLSLLAGCSSGPRLNTDYTSANQDSRVQFIVLHYTSTDLPHSLGILTHGGVSAHYLIGDDEPATVYRLVDENRRAWHAGVSEWQGRTWLNATSIGIEIVNQGYRDTPPGAGLVSVQRSADPGADPPAEGHRQAPRHHPGPDHRTQRYRAGPQGRSGSAVPLEAPRRRRPGALAEARRIGAPARRTERPAAGCALVPAAVGAARLPGAADRRAGEGHPRRHRRFPDEIPSGPLRWRAGPGNRRPAAGGADFLRPVEKPAGSGPGHTGSSM